MTELDKLIEAVEAGDDYAENEACRGINKAHRNVGDLWPAHDAIKAFRGSLDAAKRLHDALLPGWGWQRPAASWEPDSVAVKSPKWTEGDDDDEGGYPWFKGFAVEPARAWLLSILKAYRSLQ